MWSLNSKLITPKQEKGHGNKTGNASLSANSIVVSFEGIDGSGKTTLLKLASEALRKLSIDVTVVSSSSGSFISRTDFELKKITHNADWSIDSYSEFLLYLVRLREKALYINKLSQAPNPKCILVDRYVDSPMVLMNYGREHNCLHHEKLIDWVIDSMWPSLTVICHVPNTEIALSRKSMSGEAPSRKELEGKVLLDKLLTGFTKMPELYPSRTFLTIDTSRTSTCDSTKLIIRAINNIFKGNS